jgi:RluA family pseudouridine synthase
MHDHFIIINKPAGLLVHQLHAKHTEITLADWIMHQFANIGHVGCVDRPGIIHRLDKYTSGLMIIARTNYGYKQLGQLFHDRAIKKTYAAIVQHHPPQQGTIDLAIGRHQTHRTKMVATAQPMPEDTSGTFRHAVTHYQVLQYHNDATLVKVQLETGRTHQIRVHFAAIGFPLVGDILYGQKSPLIARQALHAWELAFVFDGQEYHFTSQLPEDMQECIKTLKIDYSRG